MTQQYDNTNRGVLFYNQTKKSERGPDWSGNINVDGQEFFLDAWVKQGRSGAEFLSVSIKKKDKQGAQKPRQEAGREPKRHGDRPGGAFNRPSTGFDDMDDDIPF